MQILFSPAVRLMNRLRIARKFSVLAMIYFSAVGGVGYALFFNLSRVVLSAESEHDGLAVVGPLTRTMQLVQMHRGLTAVLRGGDESVREALAAEELEAEASFSALQVQISTHLLPSEEWRQIQAEWTDIKTLGPKSSPSENYLAHIALLSRLETLNRNIAEQKSLAFDPEIGAHYLLDTAIVEMPLALEKLARLRGLGAAVLAEKKISGDQISMVTRWVTEFDVAREALAFNLGKASDHNPEIRGPLTDGLKPFYGTLPSLLDRVQSDIKTERFTISSGDFYNAATAVIDSGYVLIQQTLLPTAEKLIEARLQRARMELVYVGGIAFFLLLVSCYFLAGIYYSTVQSIRTLADSARKFADGDLTQRVRLETEDEIGQVGDSFNVMANGFNGLLTARLVDENRLRAIVNSALDGVVQMDSEGIISGWSKQAEAIFGWTSEEAVGRALRETIIPVRHREAHQRGLNHFLATGKGPVLDRRVEIEGLHREGREFPIELAISATETERGFEFNAFVRDITSRRKAEADLRIAAIAFETEESIVITDANGNALSVNQSFTQTTGYTVDEVAGKSPFIFKSDRNDPKQFQIMWAALENTRHWEGEIWGRRKNGEEFLEWIRFTGVSDEAGQITNFVVVSSDITQRRKSEETIHQLAFYNPLTGLPNRRLLVDRLKKSIASSERSRKHGALLLINVDNFKSLNDTLGHDVGDMILQQIAQRLTVCVRTEDTLAHMGGDEFMVMLARLNVDADDSAAQAEAVGEKIRVALSQGYQVADSNHRSTASIGATLFHAQNASVDELLTQVDLAMQKSKESGRNAVHFFDPAMQTAVLERAALEVELRRGIESHQLVVHYQAQVVESGRVTGAEALVRWRHPARGMVSPAEFIPLAEETGLIFPLGEWVLRVACTQLALWAARPDTAHLTIAVNVSAKQFHAPGFVETVLAAIRQTRADPNRLKLELTESLLVSNLEGVIEKMFALKARGIGFSLDDFGTGYSSLSYLKRLPLDQLKIDQSFVRDILVDPSDEAIAKTIVALGRSLGLGVIAEGVETQAQLDLLARINCHAYQGYLFGRPMPIGEFEMFALGRE